MQCLVVKHHVFTLMYQITTTFSQKQMQLLEYRKLSYSLVSDTLKRMCNRNLAKYPWCSFFTKAFNGSRVYANGFREKAPS